MFENLYYNKPVSESARKLLCEPVNEDLIRNNKYANNTAYVSESIYRRILNKVAKHEWSFVPHSVEEMKDPKGKPYIRYIGMLIVPGFGIHTGIGTQTLEKKDNQNATAAAKTYAFKNACKEMGLAPNITDGETFDEELFENIDDEEIDLSELEAPKKKVIKKKKKKEVAKKPAPIKKKVKKKLPPPNTEDHIAEVREAYDLEDDDDFVAFIQIWDEDILELDDLDDDDWDAFLEYLEENKDEFEDF